MRRVLRIVGSVFASVVYVWFAAVRSVPAVHRRKALRRRAGRGGR